MRFALHNYSYLWRSKRAFESRRELCARKTTQFYRVVRLLQTYHLKPLNPSVNTRLFPHILTISLYHNEEQKATAPHKITQDF